MNLRAAAFSAGRWTAFAAILVVTLQLLQTVILARLLLPAEFGLMAVAAAVLAVLSLVADFGLSRALIHFDELSQDTLASLYWLNMGLAVFLMLLLIGSAPFIGMMYNSRSLNSVLQLASLVFPLTALGQQSRVLAEKSMLFSNVARIEVTASAVALCAAVAVALGGGGVYALVFGILVRAAVNSLLAWLCLPFRRIPPFRLHYREARPYLRFGAYLTGDSFAGTAVLQADVFIGGLVLGPASMGVYSVPRDLSLRVASVINPSITRIGFPVMARMKLERDRLRSVYLQTLRMTASVNIPIYVALALFADEIVALLYGVQWRDAGIYLKILAAWGLIRSTGNPVGSLLYAVGRARLAFGWNVVLLLTLPVLYWVAADRFGLVGLAISAVLIQAILVLPIWRYLVRPCSGASLSEYLAQLAVPLCLAVLSGFVAWLASHGLHHGTLRLLVGGGTGTISYLWLSWMFNRRWSTAMLELLNPR